MLAQNFKTAADLGISEGDIVGLIKVLGMLERREVQHVDVPDSSDVRMQPTADHLFNMGNTYIVVDCKTAACIAGTSDLFCGTNFVTKKNKTLRSKKMPCGLTELFAPSIPEAEWDFITTDQAAAALRSYLTTGEANWAEALGRSA